MPCSPYCYERFEFVRCEMQLACGESLHGAWLRGLRCIMLGGCAKLCNLCKASTNFVDWAPHRWSYLSKWEGPSMVAPCTTRLNHASDLLFASIWCSIWLGIYMTWQVFNGKTCRYGSACRQPCMGVFACLTVRIGCAVGARDGNHAAMCNSRACVGLSGACCWQALEFCCCMVWCHLGASLGVGNGGGNNPIGAI